MIWLSVDDGEDLTNQIPQCRFVVIQLREEEMNLFFIQSIHCKTKADTPTFSH